MVDPPDQNQPLLPKLVQEVQDAEYAAHEKEIAWVRELLERDDVADATKAAVLRAINEGEDLTTLAEALPADMMAKRPAKTESTLTFSGSATVSDFLGR